MKLLDDVRVLNNKYEKYGITKEMIGTIIEADIRWDSFYVNFQDQRIYDNEFMNNDENIFTLNNDINLGIKICDLEIVNISSISDDEIYENLPENHKNCWCKVENGYIINLQGEKKNKTAYHYNS